MPRSRRIPVISAARRAVRAGTVARGVVEARATTAGVKRGGKRFGEAVWGPAARLSGVLWLELTGVFFGLFMLTSGAEGMDQAKGLCRGRGGARARVVRGRHVGRLRVVFGE